MPKKKYTPQQKYSYHKTRERSPKKYGIKFGDTKHLYSCGFTDGFDFIDNTAATRNEFGKKGGLAYSLGNKRGKKAALEYSESTGKVSH